MRKFIIDTDIGADADDVVALGYLLKKGNSGLCEVSAVTICSAREKAENCVYSVLNEYGKSDIPVGKYDGTPLGCDKNDNYAADMATAGVKTRNAVKLMRKVLAENDKTDIICIGPMVNLEGLLKSVADEFSPLSGIELVKEKVGKTFVMAFSFEERAEDFAEWNVEQSVSSAKYVVENYPSEIMFFPSEVGAKVDFYLKNAFGTVRQSLELFFEKIDLRSGKNYVYDPERTRPCWDPLTVYAAFNESDLVFSEAGNIIVDERGVSVFKPKKQGKHRYLSLKNDFKKVENELNSYMRTKA